MKTQVGQFCESELTGSRSERRRNTGVYGFDKKKKGFCRKGRNISIHKGALG